jgi:hypothetical protein
VSLPYALLSKIGKNTINPIANFIETLNSGMLINYALFRINFIILVIIIKYNILIKKDILTLKFHIFPMIIGAYEYFATGFSLEVVNGIIEVTLNIQDIPGRYFEYVAPGDTAYNPVISGHITDQMRIICPKRAYISKEMGRAIYDSTAIMRRSLLLRKHYKNCIL